MFISKFLTVMFNLNKNNCGGKKQINKNHIHQTGFILITRADQAIGAVCQTSVKTLWERAFKVESELPLDFCESFVIRFDSKETTLDCNPNN